jgi:hypothetical protein
VGERALQALCAVARAKGAPAPERAALGSLMQALPHRDHAAEAERFKRHRLDAAGADEPLRDVVRAFRAWLERDEPPPER